jgi:GntR family transcriptional regulator
VPIEPNSHADATLSQRIASELRTSIHCGDYLPGHRLPSGRALMRKYGVARQTVQNAFDLLRREGLIDARTGAGTFVRHRPAVLGLARNQPTRGADDPATTRVEPADTQAAAALGVGVGAELVVRERVVHADGAPVQLATSRTPADAAPADRVVEYVSTRPASSTEAVRLRLGPGAPVLCVTRVGFDASGAAVELHDMVLSGERYQLIYELPAD